MTDAAEITGQCLCGAVKFTAKPEKREVGICHCGMCRKWAAGPFLAIDCGGTVRFEGEENITKYRSSDWGERWFCKACGSNLGWKMHDKPHYIMSVEAFDNVEGLKLDHEIFIDEKPDYYSFKNDTKKMTGAEVMAAFASGDCKDD